MSLSADQKLSITKDDIKIIAGKAKLTIDQTKQLLQSLLQFVLEQTIMEVESYLIKIVPVRTGKLQKDLLDELRQSKITNFVLKIFIHTDIIYAARVNQMSTYNVRHTGTWYENPNRRGYRAKARNRHGDWVYLDDPTAEGHFFDKLVKFTKDRIMVNLARGKMLISQGSPLTTRNLSVVEA